MRGDAPVGRPHRLGGGSACERGRHAYVSTRCTEEKRAIGAGWPLARVARLGPLRDPEEEVASVASAKRELLLRVHRHRLRREDLEDCFSQATLELLARVRHGGTFANRLHTANALELRFVSRIRDRRRALSGRSPMQSALEEAASLGVGSAEIEIVDARACIETLVVLRDELRDIGRIARELTLDQRLALGSQLSGEACSAFCSRSGWSREKYRKVLQRARARLRELASDEPVCPTSRPGVGSDTRTDR